MNNITPLLKQQKSDVPQIIFFGNGILADTAKAVLEEHVKILFHARKADDLMIVRKITEKAHKESRKVHAVLASFGVILPESILQLFEPEGIINIHPSLLPKYRGPSPIETAILCGDTEFGVSIMKITADMDAGPVFYKIKKTFDNEVDKITIYTTLAGMAAEWIARALRAGELPMPKPQDENQATYTRKLSTEMSKLRPDIKTAQELACEIRAFAGFPKSRLKILDIDCIILTAQVMDGEDEDGQTEEESELQITNNEMILHCKDNTRLQIVSLQPAGKKSMSSKSFINGYARQQKK